MIRKRTTRRGFVRGIGLGAASLVAACGGLPAWPPGPTAGRGAARPSLIMWSLDPGELELKRWLTETTALVAKEGTFDLTLDYHAFEVLMQKEAAATSAADLPDLSLTFQATHWAQRGWSRDVADLYTEIGREGGDWYAAADSIARMAGRRIGIPVVMDLGLLFARQDLFAAAGIAPPFASFDDLVDGLKRMTGGALHGLGLSFREAVGRPALDILLAHGGRLFDRDSTPTVDTPRNRAGLAAVADLVATHRVVPPVAVAWGQDDVMDAYLNDRVAVVATNAFFIEVLRTRRPALLPTTVAMPWPAARGGAPAVSADSAQFVVNQQSRHAEQAMQIIRRLMSRQHYPALLASVEPFGFSPLRGYRDSEVYTANPLMRQIQHEVMPHAISRYADGARTPVLEAVVETLDAEVAGMAFERKPLGGAVAAIEARALAAHAALTPPPAR